MGKKVIWVFSLLSFCMMWGSVTVQADGNKDGNKTAQQDSLVAGYNAAGTDQMSDMPSDKSDVSALRSAQGMSFRSLVSTISSMVQGYLPFLVRINGTKMDADNAYYSYVKDWRFPEVGTLQAKMKKNAWDAVNLNTLIGTDIYSNDDKDLLLWVISAVQGAINPLQGVDLQRINQRDSSEIDTPESRKYLAGLRNYVASQSVVLTNLVRLRKEREPIELKKLGLPQESEKTLADLLKKYYDDSSGGKYYKGNYQNDKGQLQVSLWALERIMATRRVMDDQWYQNLAKDNPTALQRQTVEILSEQLAESFKLRSTLEDLLLTMSVVLAQLNTQARMSVEQSKPGSPNN